MRVETTERLLHVLLLQPHQPGSTALWAQSVATDLVQERSWPASVGKGWPPESKKREGVGMTPSPDTNAHTHPGEWSGSHAVHMFLVMNLRLKTGPPAKLRMEPRLLRSTSFLPPPCVLLLSTLLLTHPFDKCLQSTKAIPQWAPQLSGDST